MGFSYRGLLDRGFLGLSAVAAPRMSSLPPSHTAHAAHTEVPVDIPSDVQESSRLTFPGTTQIFFDGLMITSGASSWLWLTVTLIILPLFLFLCLSLDEYLKFLSGYWLVPVAVLVVFTLASAFITAYTDPGILPRGVNPKSEIAMNGSTDYGGDPISLLVYHPQCPGVLLGKEITSGGTKTFIKYCMTCEIFRPPRASHCSFCDNCVEEFDHHCPWVSNCIGRRNYRYFVLFLVQLSMLIDYAFGLMIAMLYKANEAMGQGIGYAILEYPGILALIILCGMTGLAVQWLVIYNLILISRDQTTSESVKGYENKSGRSFRENCCRIFFSRRPNRHVPWRTFEPHPVSSLFWSSKREV